MSHINSEKTTGGTYEENSLTDREMISQIAARIGTTDIVTTKTGKADVLNSGGESIGETDYVEFRLKSPKELAVEANIIPWRIDSGMDLNPDI